MANNPRLWGLEIPQLLNQLQSIRCQFALLEEYLRGDDKAIALLKLYYSDQLEAQQATLIKANLDDFSARLRAAISQLKEDHEKLQHQPGTGLRANHPFPPR
jgi:hypothetical protein